MKKAPFSKEKPVELVETSPLKDDSLLDSEVIRRKERTLLRLRDNQRRTAFHDPVKTQQLLKTPESSPSLPTSLTTPRPRAPEPSLEPLRYQAICGLTSATRLQALEGLVSLNVQSPVTSAALEEALQDNEAEVRAHAATLLSAIPAPLPEEILKALISRAWDRDLHVRRAAASTLGSHPDARSVGPLMGLLGTQDEELFSIVQQSLRKITKQIGPISAASDA